jgi:hypothetical protein
LYYPISDRNRVAKEETLPVPGLYIAEFCQRLTELARQRVRAGEVSERELARRASISQPHMHNVLKGIRVLSPEAADRLMQALNMTVPQVLWLGGGIDAGDVAAVPYLRHRIGPGVAASFTSFRGYTPFPLRLISPLNQPLSADLSADLALPSEFRVGDLVLIDQNPALRVLPAPTSCWVVADSAGLRVRYVRRARGHISYASRPDSGDADWQPVSLQGRNILDIVRARIVWIGREMETSLAGPVGPSRGGD